MSKLAQLIAQEEGFYVPGTIPYDRNNPGDLRHSPHSFHPPGDPDGIGQIDTIADGWADLERQLQLFAGRGLTLEQMIYEYASPPSNNTAEYLAYICSGLKCDPQMLVSDALQIT